MYCHIFVLSPYIITLEDESSKVRPDGVLRRHPDTPASQSIPRTPTLSSFAYDVALTSFLLRLRRSHKIETLYNVFYYK